MVEAPFGKNYSDIKEAPLEINNALKSELKRKIIRTLAKGKKYLSVISKDTDEHVAKVKYHLSDLERLGIVATMRLTREKFFMLTDLGRWCLRAIDIYYPTGFYGAIKNLVNKKSLKPLEPKRKLISDINSN